MSWKTWQRDHNILIPAKDWGRALALVNETRIANEIKWISFSIFYRTCWTGVKQAASSKELDDAYCGLCNSAIEQDTMHKYFLCSVTKTLWYNLQNFVYYNFNTYMSKNVNTIMFHQIDNKSKEDKIRISSLISTAKFCIWKISNSTLDPNLPGKIIWNKFSLYLSIVADSHIKLFHDLEFWYKIRYSLTNWIPENFPENIDIRRNTERDHENWRYQMNRYAINQD